MYYSKLFWAITLMLAFLPTSLNAQVDIFTESFDEGNNSTIGTSEEGVTWSTDCPTCVSGVDYFAVQNGALENLDTNGPATFTTADIDISTCSSVTISFEFSFADSWEGSGNLEYCDEQNGGTPSCNIGTPPCNTTCDPSTPLLGSCNGCWDFLWAQMLLDNAEVDSYLVGGFGTTDADQMGTIELEACTNDAATFSFIITTQTWANDEGVEIDNILIICYENDPSIEVDGELGPIDICEGEDVILNEVNVTNSKLDMGNSWSWSGPSGSSFGNNSYSLFDVDSNDSGTYTVTTTDVNGCEATDDIILNIEFCCDANAGMITIPKNE